ncbi:DUF1048 domain-containing protein [Pediococcus ethanolidurans]|uniref:DNA-binding ferritin-like protein (Dps family) n=1 Tax=Pediococcus ethanolidurans TaxID=319653 RepID=A0A0R2K7J3_9LACO|nr:DUF1048 domain-containing protein [Pediococcus ethanolidurans]KRN83301.1 hypothetical protein IV87_GL001335 [Pediococcus ethanolidurans]GEN94561.1 hypothetical protein PET01_06110 [Pediococcus ethanolidurans]SER29500.1 DNA-binding ferritin-like protein (Dps family) [Pediococcus ethanolidurans]
MFKYLKKLRQEKKAYRLYKIRIEALPPEYRHTMLALEKYLWNWAKGDGMMGLLYSILDMFEAAVADGEPIQAVVGDDIAAFADNLLREYPEETWMDKQRQKLRDSYKK